MRNAGEERIKFLILGIVVSFVLALYNAAEVVYRDNSDAATLMYVGMAGIAFFGYKILKFEKEDD